MTDRPIIFSAPMVHALLAGRKTQTRRVLSNAPHEGDWHCDRADTSSGYRFVATPGAPSLPCPLPYAIGDRLYVRESWSHTGDGVWEISSARMVGRSGVVYAADGRLAGAKYWPSIHMPREFSRLTLLVTDVRVQRLQDISQNDAQAEGAPPSHPSIDVVSRGYGFEDFSRSWFAQLWETLHTKRPKRWEDNPWVVAVSFDVVRGNIDQARVGEAA